MTILTSIEPWPTELRRDPLGELRRLPLGAVEVVAAAKAVFSARLPLVPNRLIVGLCRQREFLGAMPAWPAAPDARPTGAPDRFLGMDVVWCLGNAIELAYSLENLRNPEPKTP